MDNHGARDNDLVLERRKPPGIIFGVIGVVAGILPLQKQPVDRSMEERAPAHGVAVCMKPLRDRTSAHWTSADTELSHVIDFSDDRCFVIDNEELFPLLLAVNLDGPAFIAIGHVATVEVASRRILPAVATREQSSVVGEFFVHQPDDAAQHLAGGIIAKCLGQGMNSDAGLGKLGFVDDLGDHPACKSGKCEHDDGVDRPVWPDRRGNHLVKLLADGSGPRHACLDEDFDQLDIVAFTMRFDRRFLAGYGGIVLTFLIHRHSRVAIGPELVCHLTILKKRVDFLSEQGPQELELAGKNADMLGQVGDDVQGKSAGSAPSAFQSFSL